MNVTICTSPGRNIPADIEVHATGCQHLHRHTICSRDHWSIEAETVRQVVDAVYGPESGSFYQESAREVDGVWIDADWTDYVSGFHFAPCADLPMEAA